MIKRNSKMKNLNVENCKLIILFMIWGIIYLYTYDFTCIWKFKICFSREQWLFMIDLVLHAVLHDKKNYHSFRLKFLIKTICRNEN